MNELKMTIHKESHQDNVLCKFCCDQETLKKHYYRNHSHCMTCNKTFENIDGILYHLLLRHELRYQCKYCPFSDFDENGLDIHMKNCLNNDEIQDVDKKASHETFENDLILTNDTDVDVKKMRLSEQVIDSTNLEERLSSKNEIHDVDKKTSFETFENYLILTNDKDVDEKKVRRSEGVIDSTNLEKSLSQKNEVQDQTKVNIVTVAKDSFEINVEENVNDLEGEPETVVKNSKINSKPEVESDINTACLDQNSEMYSFDASTMYSTIQHNVKVEDISEKETSLDIKNTRIIKTHANKEEDETEEVGNNTLTYEGFDIQNLLLDDETYMLLDGKFDDLSDEDLPTGQVL